MKRSATAPTDAARATVRLTSEGLAAEDIARVAGGATLELAPEVEQLVHASRAVVERALEGGEPVYGLNTGVGSRRDRPVSREDLDRYQVQMVMDHAGGVGAPLADEDVRAIMAARIAGMARGGAGVHPGALETLVAMLNAGVHPVVPSVGSVGASDLMHMAAIAMVVMGRGQARLEGGAMPGGEALERAAIAPHRLRPKDGLALSHCPARSRQRPTCARCSQGATWQATGLRARFRTRSRSESCRRCTARSATRWRQREPPSRSS